MATTERYAKPKGASDLPTWFKQIRAGSNFMPSTIKPVSYNYMAMMEAPNRKAVYGASNPSIEPGRNPLSATGTGPSKSGTPMLRTDMGTYYAPTEKVASNIQKNNTIIQSIKTLGGEVKERAGSMMHIVGDIFSRPQYAMMNIYKDNLNYWTKGENSLGGSRVTGQEHALATAGTFTPVGLIATLVAGRGDDMLKAGWAGFSGKQKTQSINILQQQTPGFLKEHPTLARNLATTGDLLLDPVNLVSIAAAPGSVIRGAGSAGLRLFGRKEAALKLWDETFFSSAGRQASINLLKKDIIQGDVNKLNKQIRKLAKDANRKSPKYSDPIRKQKESELIAAINLKKAEDLKGADLAWRVFKKSIPTLGMGTVSRLSTGAAVSKTATAGAKRIKDAHDIHVAATVADLMKEDRWIATHKALVDTGTDINYTHAGVNYSVKIDPDFETWMERVVREGSPLAAYAEPNTRAARSRKGRVLIVESRAKNFLNALNNEFDSSIRKALSPEELASYESLNAVRAAGARGEDITSEIAQENKYHVVTEEEINNGLTYDQLREATKAKWKASPEGQGKKYNPTKTFIVIKYDDGTLRKVSLEAIRKQADNVSLRRVGKAEAEAKVASRTPNEEVVDKVTGVSDKTARRREQTLNSQARLLEKRQAVLDAALKVKQTKAVKDAAQESVMLDEGATKVAGALQAQLNKMGELTDGERASLEKILNDTTKTPAERVSEVLRSDLIDDQTALDSIKEMFQMVIKDDKVFAATRGTGSGMDAIPQLFNTIIADRWAARVAPASEKAAGVTYDSIAKQIEVIKKGQQSDPNYLRDVNGEIGLMVMDAYRYAIEYAVKTEDLMNNPHKLFVAINTEMNNFLNMATAETKVQVMQLMYNLTGMRLPENFVPSHWQVDLANDFKFTKPDGTPLNQEVVRQNLVTAMQKWAFDTFPDIVPERYTTAAGVNAKTGFDVQKLADEVARRATKYVPYEPVKGKFNDTTRAQEKVAALLAKIKGLEGEILKAGDGTLNDGTQVVNRYNMLDFLMHNEAILKSQRTTLTVTKTKAGVVNRLQSGRLSALDSFTFVSDEAKAGLAAVGDLKKLSKSSDPNIAKAAQEAIADLFVKNGGLDYLNEVKMPESENLADLNISPPLYRLGSHAALKEEAIGKQEQFGYKLRADLMDHLWGGPTLIHEWQKSVQTKILHDVYIKGMTKEQSAKKLSENLADTFYNHDKIKRMLYPVMRNAKITDPETGIVRRGPKETVSDMAGNSWSRSGTLEETWGKNEVTALRKSPQVVVHDTPELALPFNKGEYKAVDMFGDKTNAIGAPVKDARATLSREVDGNDEIINQLFPPKLAMRDGRWIAIKNPENGKTVGYASSYKGSPEKGNATMYQIYTLHDKKLTKITAAGRNFKATLEKAIDGAKYMDRHDPRIDPKDYAPSPILHGVEEMPPAQKVIPGKEKDLPFRADSPEVSKAADLWEADTAHAAAKVDAQAATTDYVNTLKSSEPDTIPAGAEETVGVEAPAPVDSANVGDGSDMTDFSELERSAIVDYIRKTYDGASPEEVAKYLDAMSTSLSIDIMEAQARLQTNASDLSFKHQRKVRFAGIPLMNATGPVNITHQLAGVTALNDDRAGAGKFFRGRFKRTPDLDRNDLTGAQKIARKFTRQSQVFEGSLDRIRMGVVNASNMERKFIISQFNKKYVKGVNKGEFVNTNVAAMSARQRADYLASSFFDPSHGKVPDRLNEFEDVAGENTGKWIEARMNSIHDSLFAGLTPDKLPEQIKTFNKYLTKKYRLTTTQIDNIEAAGINAKYSPFTREWFIAVGKMTLPTPYHKLAEGNIADLHYALEDAKLKVRAGAELQHGVFEEFSFLMDPKLADFHNRELSPRTFDSHGVPMRGKYVSIKQLTRIIDPRYIPSEFIRADRYIPEDIIPEIKILFDYMNDVSDLNDQLNVNFIDKLLTFFKASVTIYKIPTYPVKNTISDVFMGAMDGLTNPRYYKSAIEIMNGHHKAMQDINLEDYMSILDEKFVNTSLAKASHDPASVKQPTDIAPNMRARVTLLTDEGDVSLNDSQLMHLYDELGLGQNRVVGEFTESVAATRKRGVSKGAGKIHDLVKNANDVREDWARVAHFLFALEREAPFGGSLEDVARRAADRVMKYHFDYGDVSLWERGRLARPIPFYKWVKNIVPFTLASMVTAPRYMNIEQAIGEVVGQTINDNPDDVGFKDFVLPEYIQRENAVPIGWFQNNKNNRFNQYLVMGLPLSETVSKTIAPTIDPWINGEFDSFATQLEESGKGAFTTALSMTNPIIKGVLQGTYGQTLWPTGPAPEKPEESWYKTMAAVIPGFPAFDDIKKNITPDEKLAGYTGMNAPAKILDSLGAVTVYNNTEKAQVGSLMKTKDRHTATLTQRKAVIAKRVLEKYPHLTPEQADAVVLEYIKQERG